MVVKRIILAFLSGILFTYGALQLRDACTSPRVTAPAVAAPTEEEDEAPPDNLHHVMHDDDPYRL